MTDPMDQELIAGLAAERDRLRARNAELVEALQWIAHEAGQYADGAEDAHYLARVLAEFEEYAKAALAKDKTPDSR